MKKSELTVERVRELFSYDPETGILTRRSKMRGAKPGSAAGYMGAAGYLRVKIHCGDYRVSRVIWFLVHGEWPLLVDHINGIRTDNRLCNLRSATHAINSQNIRSATGRDKAVRLLGVVRVKGSGPGLPWKAVIKASGKGHILGRFQTQEEAHAAYVKAKRELHPGCTI